MEAKASTLVPLLPSVLDPLPLKVAGPIRLKLAYVDVYVNDFIKLAQGWSNTMQVQCHAFHNIDRVF